MGPILEHCDCARREDSLRDLVYRNILGDIIEYTLLPGSSINAARIAETLSISRSPVRAALEVLIDDGLVERCGEKKLKVKNFDWGSYSDLSDIRSAIEGESAFHAADCLTEADFYRLHEIIRQSRVCINEADYFTFLDLDAEFHERIVAGTGNPYLIGMYKQLSKDIYIGKGRNFFWNLKYSRKSPRFRAIEERYIAIYKALKSRSPTLAKSEMEEHLKHCLRDGVEYSRHGCPEGTPQLNVGDVSQPRASRSISDRSLKKEGWSKAEQSVFKALLGGMNSGALHPGDRTDLAALAAECALDAKDTAEALSSLSKRGFLTLKGEEFFVALLSVKNHTLLCEARMALEGRAASFAAIRILPFELKSLGHFITDMRLQLECGNTVHFLDLAAEFRACVVHASHNKYIIDLYETLSLYILWSKLLFSVSPGAEGAIAEVGPVILEKCLTLYRALKYHYSKLAGEEMREQAAYENNLLLELDWAIRS